ncbi:MAG: hypothetical protein ACI9UN_004606 [Granulosicoccus sp.]|jgi:hypothetical protein
MSSTLCRLLVCWASVISLFTIGAVHANDRSLLRSTCDSARNSPWYIQYQFGIASESDFGHSLFFRVEQSQERSKLHTLSFAKRLSGTFYGRILDVTAHVGIQHFAEQGFQNDIIGTTTYWRLGRRIYLPYTTIPIKINLAQRLSYASDIPTAEVRDYDPQSSAKLTHYLEYGLHYSFRKHFAHNRLFVSHWF